MVVYILRSESTGRYYTGSTVNLENRLREHNSGENKSTRRGRPWMVVHVEEVANRSEAYALEKKIKARGARRYFEEMRMAG